MEEKVKTITAEQPEIGGGAVGEPAMTTTDTVAVAENLPATAEIVAHQVAEPHVNGNGLTPEAPAGDEVEASPMIELEAATPAETESAIAIPTAELEAGSEPAAELATEPEPEMEAATAAEPERPMSLMEQLLNESASTLKALHYGDVIEGTVMHKDREEILVDIGAKSEGRVPSKELQTLTPVELTEVKIGDQILVFVVQPENAEGHAVLSIDKAKMEKSWRRLQKQFEAGEIIEAEVTGYNKGGLLVNLEGVRGFVPASQVTGLTAGTDAAKQSEMTRLVNSKMPLKVIEINRHRNRLILSERQAAQEQRDAQKDRLMSELEQGQVRDGEVTSICDFGAFVDIGGADGLVHLSELSWSRINHPNELLKVGQKVKVYVLSVDDAEKKVALSIKRTQAEPWTQVMAKYKPGDLVEGTITQLANFGAFARIADGIEGLIHVSELAEGRVQHPRSVVKEGDNVTLRIIRIDPQRKRMGLSLKRAVEGYEGSLTELTDEEENGRSRSRGKREDQVEEQVEQPEAVTTA